MERMPEKLLEMTKFRLVTKIHPMRFKEASEQALKDFDDDYTFEDIEGEDFKFRLKVS